MTPALKRLEGDPKRIAKCTGEGRGGEERGAGEGEMEGGREEGTLAEDERGRGWWWSLAEE